MKKAITLIEILVVIVAVSILFPLVIKIYSALIQSEKISIESQIFSKPISLITYISNLPWDENSSKSGEILLTDSKNTYLECNKKTKLRIGSFSKKRNCIHLLKASLLKEDGKNQIDDLDDFNKKIFFFYKNRKKYKISVYVNYALEEIKYDYTKKSAVIDLSKSLVSKKSTNLKEITLTLSLEDKNITSFKYFSANLGNILIEGKEW